MKIRFFKIGFVLIFCSLLVLQVSAVSVPEAAFVSNATDGTVPMTVQFIDESTNSPTSWLWSFGDGSTSAIKNPTHTYTTAGTYTVTLTATNSAGSSTVTESGYITATRTGSAPVAAFVANVTAGTIPLSVQFVDSSTNSPTLWVWSFGDGGSATIQNPTHTYSSAGTYAVTLTVTNAAGSNTVSKSGYITANKEAAVPGTSFAATETSGPAPFTVQFIDTSENSPTSWAWSFGDGSSSTSQNPSHTYTSVGTYTVTLTATNTAGSATDTETDYITVDLAAPDTTFTADITAGTVPLTVNFTDTSGNSPTEWYWVFGDGDTSTDQNVTHIYSSAGTYTVKLTAYNSEGSNKTIKTDYITVVTGTSAPGASFLADVTQGSNPLTVQFTDSSTSSPTSWSWSFGDGVTSTLQNPSHTYTSDGTFTVQLTATNSGGSNSVTRSGYITVSSESVTTGATTYPTEATVLPADTTPLSADTTSSGDTAKGSTSGGSSGSFTAIGVIVLIIIGIIAFLLLKRPPGRSPHAGGRDL
jgi:PKD repeat protein